MLNFISENIGSIIVGIVVFAIIILALIKVIRDKRLSCSCSSECSGCAGCGTCHLSKSDGDISIKPTDIKIKRINKNGRSD